MHQVDLVGLGDLSILLAPQPEKRIATLWMPVWWLKTQQLVRCQSPAGTQSACLRYSQLSVLLPLYGKMLEGKEVRKWIFG